MRKKLSIVGFVQKPIRKIDAPNFRVNKFSNIIRVECG